MENNRHISIYLRPGEFYVSAEPVAIKTVLGSCVSVCLHDKLNKVGGVNHYLLPRMKESGDNSWLYGELSIPQLIDTVVQEGGNKRSLTAYVVGGSNSLGGSFDVGRDNIEIARKILHDESIPITHEEVGGASGRVLRFYPYTNELFVRSAGAEEATSYSKVADHKSVSDANFVQLTPDQTQFMRNLLSAGLQRAQQSLGTMLNSGVEIAIAEVMLRKMSYVQEYASSRFNEFVITTGQKEMRPLGEVMMMLDPGKMAAIVNTLLGRPVNTPLAYDRMQTSAIVELANILVNAILGTLANHLGFAMMLRVPKLSQSLGELQSLPFMNTSKQWKLALAVKTAVKIPALSIDSVLLLLVELRTPAVFFEKLGE